jgi:acyl-CoA synthetase (AMP-forming)/AMP-acid ligase II
MPSTEWGEAVAVAVAFKGDAPSETELKTLIRDRLRSSRVPEKIVVVEALPYNEMGKLLRREVRRLFQ